MVDGFRVDRSLDLICDFKDGYAVGWFFAVGDFFKDQLDIKYTPIIETTKHNGEVKKERVMKWTQGPFYCFAEGQIIYDTANAYTIWSEAISLFKYRCEVIRSTPNHPNDKIIQDWSSFYRSKDGSWWARQKKQSQKDTLPPIHLEKSIEKYIHGSVTFTVSSPNQAKTGMDVLGQFQCSQFKFIDFLKTGKMEGINLNV